MGEAIHVTLESGGRDYTAVAGHRSGWVETLVFDRILSPAERARVRAYLLDRYWPSKRKRRQLDVRAGLELRGQSMRRRRRRQPTIFIVDEAGYYDALLAELDDGDDD